MTINFGDAMSPRHARLQRLLTEALDLADALDLPMVAIHVDEARSQMLPQTALVAH